MSKSIFFRASTLALFAVSAFTAHAERIFGASATSLYSFDSASPAGFTTIGDFSGIVDGQTIQSIDFRPATGTLYALSSGGTRAQLYTVNLASGALTTVGSGFATTGRSFDLASIDFNPTVDRLRVVSASNTNLRINPDNGAVAATDTALSLRGISGIAYTNSVVGATQTTLYAYNTSNNTLNTIGGVNGVPSPNGGGVNVVGPSGVQVFTEPGAVGFDISGATGIGYITLDDATSDLVNSEFFTVNLGTGALTKVGGNDVLPAFLDIAVAPQAVPEPATIAALGLGALAMLRRRRKA